jgi:hypothetical protein
LGVATKTAEQPSCWNQLSISAGTECSAILFSGRCGIINDTDDLDLRHEGTEKLVYRFDVGTASLFTQIEKCFSGIQFVADRREE